ncbi:protein of unknown function [Pseudomonas sp. JV241A]|nr:protein of unknown function [Pseudomonas sp. JV241A]
MASPVNIAAGTCAGIGSRRTSRFSEARDKVARKLTADGNADLAVKVRQFQSRVIRPKAASKIEDVALAKWSARPSNTLMRKRRLIMRK